MRTPSLRVAFLGFVIGASCFASCVSNTRLPGDPVDGAGGDSDGEDPAGSGGAGGTGGHEGAGAAGGAGEEAVCDFPIPRPGDDVRLPAWDEGESECPPGPIVTLLGQPCEEDLNCYYGGGRYTGYGFFDLNSAVLDCHEGKYVIGITLICCDDHVLSACPNEATEGAQCTDVGECFRTGPGANLEDGYVNGSVCACDEPGPAWRCTPVCQTCLGELDESGRYDCGTSTAGE